VFLFEPQSSLVRIVNPAVIREPFSASSRGPETLVLYRMRPVVEWQVDLGVGRGASDTAV